MNTESKDFDRRYQVGSKLEANHIFPATSTSDLKSPYYRDSYDYPYNPDPLCSGNNYSIYDEMRKDDQIKVCLSLKKDMVVNSGWEIESENKEAKEFFEKNLQNLYNPDSTDYSFEDVLRDMLSSYDYGFSNSEIIWKLEENKYNLSAIKTRAPHTWQFELDDKGTILRLMQSGARGFNQLDPKNFIHFVYQPEFSNPYGKSDLQAAHIAWKAKKFFQRMYCVYIERFAGPTVIAKYKANITQDEEIDKIQELVNSIQNNSTLTVPDDVVIEFIQQNRDASDAYSKGINLWNLAISRAILIPDLMGVSGEKTGGGSYALGKTQFKSFLSSIQKDRASLERKINLRVINPLKAVNFGKDVEVKFKLKPWSVEDVNEYLKLWVDAVSKNIYKPGIDEIDHFRESIKFPTPEIDESTISAKGNNGEQIEQVPERTQPEPPGHQEKPAQEQKRGDYGLLIFRDLYDCEKKVDFASVKRALDVSERSLTQSMSDITRKMRNDLISQVRDKNIVRNFKPQAIEQIQPKYAREMNAALKSEFKQLFREASTEARKEILPNGTKKYVEGDIFPEDFERILEAESFKIVGDYQTDIKKRTTNKLIKGIKDGIPENELVNVIRDDLESNTEKWLSALVRTKSTEIYNAARKITWETDPLISQIVEAYEFSAILDERTSDVCKFLDGKKFELGDFMDRITPPLHINCRSILVPMTRYEDYKLDREPSLKKLKEMGGGLIVVEES